jgi:hypothetical protein
MVPEKSRRARHHFPRMVRIASVLLLLHVLWPLRCQAAEVFDLVSGIMDAPLFRGKDPITRLRAAADLLGSNQIQQSDMVFVVMDWTDQYLREPSDPIERLKRWAMLGQDEKLSHLKIPRDVFNRVLVAEYLVNDTPYLKISPEKRLKILKKLGSLVDWTVALSYARLYAGDIISGAKSFQYRTPAEALALLKKLADEGLVGWHYRVPAEATLVAEMLAADKDYQKATPLNQLIKLRELEHKGLITPVNKKELEKLSAWRLLINDPSFLKADADTKRARLLKLKEDGLITAFTYSDLHGIFRPMPLSQQIKSAPVPMPHKLPPPAN